MITRHHTSEEKHSKAIYSDCEAYRYCLTRRWSDGPVVNFIMLNPSVADETKNDPTIERCERRARMLGFCAYSITNVFAWRATDPRDLRRADNPEGPENRSVVEDAAREADLVIAAWGVHGAHFAQGPSTAKRLRDQDLILHHLGLTKDGHPRHPLYVSFSQQPVVWSDARS